MPSELKPCPFCGVAPLTVNDDAPMVIKNKKYHVWCANDDCPIRPNLYNMPDRATANRTWNTRTAPPDSQTVPERRCVLCKHGDILVNGRCTALINTNDRHHHGARHCGCACEFSATVPAAEESSFRQELGHLINRYSIENGSNTPDFILAKFLVGVLCHFNGVINERERWYGREVDRLPDGLTLEDVRTTPHPVAPQGEKQ